MQLIYAVLLFIKPNPVSMKRCNNGKFPFPISIQIKKNGIAGRIGDQRFDFPFPFGICRRSKLKHTVFT
ncbi:hypothetical protein IMSAG025_01731 [Muribaculaceae bacterium]|nr:hypothetical protein IMSAG025_01731 [Muribaculaceae bacterium]